MHKYEVRFKYNNKSGGCTSKTAVITFPKRVYSFSEVYGNDGKGNNEILTKAVNELGLNPDMVEAISDRNKLDGSWYNLKYLGEESDINNSSYNDSNQSTNYNIGSGIGNAASGIGDGISSVLGSLGTGASKAISYLEADKLKREEKDREIEESINVQNNEIINFTFSNSKESIVREMSKLLSMYNSTPLSNYSTKSTIYSKINEGIILLKGLNASVEVEHFEAEQKKIKPNKLFEVFFSIKREYRLAIIFLSFSFIFLIIIKVLEYIRLH